MLLMSSTGDGLEEEGVCEEMELKERVFARVFAGDTEKSGANLATQASGGRGEGSKPCKALSTVMCDTTC